MIAQAVMPARPRALRRAAGKAGERPRERQRSIDFEDLVGANGWHRLAPAIRRRFTATHTAHRPATYVGTMTSVASSTVGLAFATLGRLVGTPLAPWRGADVPLAVRVYPDSNRNGIVWERRYRFPGRQEIVIRSTKVWNPATGMIEQLGGGFSMALQVFEKDASLHFTSERYFLTLFGWKVPLPLLATPGRLEVVHADEGNGRFRFTMTIRHPLFGVTFFQDGVFHDHKDEGEKS